MNTDLLMIWLLIWLKVKVVLYGLVKTTTEMFNRILLLKDLVLLDLWPVSWFLQMELLKLRLLMEQSLDITDYINKVKKPLLTQLLQFSLGVEDLNIEQNLTITSNLLFSVKNLKELLLKPLRMVSWLKILLFVFIILTMSHVKNMF